jgi:2-haloacid dehalogenase
MILRPLDDVEACVFDAYGTLFDPSSAARACADVLGDKAAPLAALWRHKQFQYSWLLTVQGRYADFAEVTGEALDFALATFKIDSPDLRGRLMKLYLTLDVFPEVREALSRLKDAGLRLAILSNGTPAMLDAMIANGKLDGFFDAVLSVDELGVYKPDRKVYQQALDRLGLPAPAIAFVSSNGWDAYAASAFGMKVVWCNRAGQPPERLPGAPDRVARSLAELPELIRPRDRR